MTVTTRGSVPQIRGEGKAMQQPERDFSRTPKVRREAGWKLLEERYDEIEVLREDYIRVPSTSIRGRVYTCQPSKLRCTCPDNSLEGNCCKHTLASTFASTIYGSGYRIEKVHNGRLPFEEWHVYDRETGEMKGVRYSFAEAYLDVLELAQAREAGRLG